MKVSLVVASGVHQGKVIPIPVAQFLIGRDPQCHLRPASQAISKRHCGLLIRDGKVYVQDFGSTNGTIVNGELLQSGQVEVQDGASVQLGPLEFRVRIERPAPQPDGTPLPRADASTIAAVKAAVAATPQAPPRDATPNPARPVKSAAGSKSTPPVAPPPPPQPASGDDDQDRVAAMLLEMDEGNGDVPEGSTVMEMPALGAEFTASKSPETKPAQDKDKKKLAQTREEMSQAASEILRKMMRRPK